MVIFLFKVDKQLFFRIRKGERDDFRVVIARWLKCWWTGRDLNPRLPPCEGGIHTTELPAHQEVSPLRERYVKELLSFYLFIDVKVYSVVDATLLELHTYFRFIESIR